MHLTQIQFDSEHSAPHTWMPKWSDEIMPMSCGNERNTMFRCCIVRLVLHFAMQSQFCVLHISVVFKSQRITCIIQQHNQTQWNHHMSICYAQFTIHDVMIDKAPLSVWISMWMPHKFPLTCQSLFSQMMVERVLVTDLCKIIELCVCAPNKRYLWSWFWPRGE